MRQTSHLQPDTNAGRWRYGITCLALGLMLSLLVGNRLHADERTVEMPLIETSTDAESLLVEAVQLIEDGRVSDGLRVFELVRERWGDKMVIETSDVFVSINDKIDELIAELDEEALRIYRFEADPSVRRLLGEPVENVVDPTLLRQVVDRYFNSSLGDDAAYRLANLALDGGRLFEAESNLIRILREHPDSDINRQEIYFRLMVIAMTRGDRKQARQWIAELTPEQRAIMNELDWANLTTVLGADRNVGQSIDPAWEPLPAANSVLQVWERELELDLELLFSRFAHYRRYRMMDRTQLVDRWREQGWFPTGEIAIDDHILIIKDQRSLVGLDKRTGLLLWRADEPKLSSSALPGQIRQYTPGRMSSTPQTAEEVLAFGERISPQVTLADGVAYHIEGFGFGRGYGQGVVRIYNNHVLPLGTHLAAHETRTGRLRWRIDFNHTEASRAEDYRVISRPTVIGDRVIVAVEQNSSEFWVIAVDRRNGEVLWRRFVVGYSQNSAPPWVPASITHEGSDLVVATQRGVVAMLDMETGRLRWGSSYPRSHRTTNSRNRINTWSASNPGYWLNGGIDLDDDRITFFPGDANAIIQINRLTGEIIQDIETKHQGLYIGKIAEGYLTASSDQLTLLNTRDLKEVWSRSIGKISGVPRLVGEELIVPADDHLLKLNPTDGKTNRTIRVTYHGSAPLGTVFSDGTNLYGIGAQTVFAIVEPTTELQRLTEELDRKTSAPLQLARARILAHEGRIEEAIESYESILTSRGARRDKDAARGQLFAVLLQRDQDSDLQRASELAGNTSQVAQVLYRRGQLAESNKDLAKAVTMYQGLLALGEGRFVQPGPDSPEFSLAPAELGIRLLAGLADHPEVASLLNEKASEQLAAAMELKPADRLEPLVNTIRAYPTTPIAFDAIEAAVDLLQERKQTALIGLLSKELRRSKHPALRERGLLVAARNAEQQDRFAEARMLYEQLLALHPAATPGEEAIPEHPDRLIYEQALARIGEQPPLEIATGELGPPPWELSRRLEIRRANILEFTTTEAGRDEMTAWVGQHLFVYDSNGVIRCLDGRTGQEVWQTTLDADLRQAIRRRGRSLTVRGGIQGHVIVLMSQSRVIAMSVNDGRTLWNRAYGDDERIRFGKSRSSRAPMYYAVNPNDADGAGGMFFEKHFAEDNRADIIIARDVMTGRPIWQRRLSGYTINQVGAHDGLVVLAVNGNQGFLSFDAQTGVPYQAISTAGQSDVRLDSFAESGAILRTGNSILLKDYRTGETRWTVATSGATRRLIRVANDYLFYQRQDYVGGLVEIATGRQLALVRLTEEAGNIFDVGYDAKSNQLIMYATTNKRKLLIHRADSTNEKPQQIHESDNRSTANIPSAQTLAEMGDWLIWAQITRKRVKNNNIVISEIRFLPRDKNVTGDPPVITPPDEAEHFSNHMAPPMVINGKLILSFDSEMLIYAPNAQAEEEKP